MARRRTRRTTSTGRGTFQKKMKACLLKKRGQPGSQKAKFAACARQSARR